MRAATSILYKPRVERRRNALYKNWKINLHTSGGKWKNQALISRKNDYSYGKPTPTKNPSQTRHVRKISLVDCRTLSFNLEFTPRTLMRSQALSDFIAEWSFAIPEEIKVLKDQKEKGWTLFTDGSSTSDVEEQESFWPSLAATRSQKQLNSFSM